MTLSEFLMPTKEYTARRGPMDKIVLSSRVRLARNLFQLPFPAKAKKSVHLKILNEIKQAVQTIPDISSEGLIVSMDELSNNDKTVLVERHLISREHAKRGAGSGLAINKEENISLMINEEDHLRMQAIFPGSQVRNAWKKIDSIDTLLGKVLNYAFHPQYGYLTACPTNLGTGIRVSAMLHLPGLVLRDQINQIINAVNKIGLAVRGIYGEGSAALGNLFQASNQMTLGITEESIVSKLEKVINALIENEEEARRHLLAEKGQITLLNHIGRAYGILSNAYSIDSQEALNYLSLIRLGVDLGIFPHGDRFMVEELFLFIQKGHFQLFSKDSLSTPQQRDIARASLLREGILKFGTPRQVKTASSSEKGI